jgi:hypothetical protein
MELNFIDNLLSEGVRGATESRASLLFRERRLGSEQGLTWRTESHFVELMFCQLSNGELKFQSVSTGIKKLDK